MSLDVIALLDELIEGQQKKVLKSGRQIIPHLTQDDIMQPNDFPELEFHPIFRYEEGTLDGIRVAKAAILCRMHESLDRS